MLHAMSQKIVYVFPDTNLFVQCHPPNQLDWALLGDFDEIHLVVSRPVQSEIDNQKNKGRDRLGDKARTTSRLFREIIVGPDDRKVLRQNQPTVTLSIRHEIQPDASLAERLDYRERDDQLVGIACQFLRENSDLDVRVLTHDTGPMAAAKMVGMTFIPIPDEWLLPPETTSGERRITSLENDIARLKAAEPSFRIGFSNGDDEPAENIAIEIRRYDSLTASEVSDLMLRIKTKFPLTSDFGPREASQRTGKRYGLSLPEVFYPATDQEIATYQEQYPRWLAECERKLSIFHQILQQREDIPRFTFVAVNEGARSAKHTLVTVKAKGDFKVMPPPFPTEDEKAEVQSLTIPQPPAAPRGSWKSDLPFERHHELMRKLGVFQEPAIGRIIPETIRLRDFRIPKHDPNAFYYKPQRPSSPAPEFELECDLWRHGVGPESFAGQIHTEKREGSVAGALECWIHAENLSDPIVMRVPVRINIRHISAYDVAKNKVEYLLAGIHL